MKINKDITGPKWYKFNDDIEFRIKAWPASQQTSMELLPAMLDRFKYCLLDWRGLGEDDEEFPVTDENKQYLYDYYRPIKEFVIAKSNVDDDLCIDELKNSLRLLSGEATQKQ